MSDFCSGEFYSRTKKAGLQLLNPSLFYFVMFCRQDRYIQRGLISN
jgi:hypothetical protein